MVTIATGERPGMDSKIDELFERMFGWVPDRDGAAFEMLFAAVQKILSPSQEVFWNQRLRGTHSRTIYQIDVHTSSVDRTVGGEAKDYTDRGAKVGRPDLQKLGGALPDLDVNSGAFASATGYTSPARKYADASEEFLGKGIALYEVRPAQAHDSKGRITTIEVHIHAAWPLWEKAQFAPVMHPRGEAALTELVRRGEIGAEPLQAGFSEIYGPDGEVHISVRDLSAGVSLEGHIDEVYATWWVPGCFISVLGHRVEVRGISFRVPIERMECGFSVDAEGSPEVIVKNETQGIDKIITDEQLRKVKFREDGFVDYHE